MGPAAVRRVRYRAARVTARINRTLRVSYLRLRAAGRPAKVALTVVMRKPVVLMNHVRKYPHFALAN